MSDKIVVKLNNGESYYIIAITYYNDEKFYITNHLNDDATKITDEFVIFREFIEDNKIVMKKIEDLEMIFQILKSLGFVN